MNAVTALEKFSFFQPVGPLSHFPFTLKSCAKNQRVKKMRKILFVKASSVCVERL